MGWNKWWIKGKYDKCNIRFRSSMITSICDNSDEYRLAKGATLAPNTVTAGAAVNDTNKKEIF